MEDIKEILIEFIEWTKYNSEDAWDIYDNTEAVVKAFLKEKYS